MAQAFIAAMPPELDLDSDCTIVFEAINPTTGAAVTGVTISNAILRVDTSLIDGGDGSGGRVDLSSGPFMFVPGPEAYA